MFDELARRVSRPSNSRPYTRWNVVVICLAAFAVSSCVNEETRKHQPIGGGACSQEVDPAPALGADARGSFIIRMDDVPAAYTGGAIATAHRTRNVLKEDPTRVACFELPVGSSRIKTGIEHAIHLGMAALEIGITIAEPAASSLSLGLSLGGGLPL